MVGTINMAGKYVKYENKTCADLFLPSFSKRLMFWAEICFLASLFFLRKRGEYSSAFPYPYIRLRKRFETRSEKFLHVVALFVLHLCKIQGFLPASMPMWFITFGSYTSQFFRNIVAMGIPLIRPWCRKFFGVWILALFLY